jgi:hypothetical protein
MQALLNVKAAGTYSDHSALKGWQYTKLRQLAVPRPATYQKGGGRQMWRIVE